MTRHSGAYLTLALVFFAAILTGCERTTISDINADPGRFRDREVTIVGRVVTSFGALGEGGYEVDDGTGRIPVITTRGVPGEGAHVRVTGRVSSGVTFAGRSFGTFIRETNRHTESSR